MNDEQPHGDWPPATVDVVVAGAGFGGLGAALTLVERGASVVLLEALDLPGRLCLHLPEGRALLRSGRHALRRL